MKGESTTFYLSIDIEKPVEKRGGWGKVVGVMSTLPQSPAIVTPQNIPVTNPDSIRAVYSNFFGASATMTDFTLFFLELGQVPGANGPTQHQTVKAMVTLPMAAAVGLQDVLGQMLEQSKQARQQFEKAALGAKK